MDSEQRRYLVHIRLGGSKPTLERIRETAPGIKSILEQISGGDCQLAYTSHDGSSFGFLLKTGLHATAVVRRLQGPDRDDSWAHPDEPVQGSPLRHEDQVLVIEIAEDFHGVRMGKAATWLQHN